MRAIVTGANRGIGFEIARQLAERGVEVVATARSPREAEETAGRIGAVPRVLDVTDPASVAALDVEDVDALVNNAGVALDGFDVEVVRRTLAVNVHGVIAVTDAVLPRMVEGGRIVMVSSGSADEASLPAPLRQRFQDPALDRDGLLRLLEEFERKVADGTHGRDGWPSSAYRVSKVGLNALTRILARERPDLRVNAACPGWVRTRMGGPNASRSPAEGADTPVWLALQQGGPTGGFFRDRKPARW